MNWTIKLAAMMAVAVLGSASNVVAQAPAGSPVQEAVIDLPLGGGLHQRVLTVGPSHPRAAIVMLPGGSGEVGLRRDGDVRHDNNFVVRTRLDWVQRGYAVLIPDSIDKSNLRGLRSAPAYAQLVDQLAAYAQAHFARHVFLLGTSQGSIAAMNGASHARPGLLAGVVLTESVSVMGHSGETVFDGDPANVRVPALVVANQADACDVAPPSMAPKIAAAMTVAPEAKVLTVDGGESASKNPCGSLSPHGYYGIEAQVIDAISGWMLTQAK